MPLRHRITAGLLALALAAQPLAISAQAPVPLAHFAPRKPVASNPFVWVSSRPTTPFIDSRPAKSWADIWRPARRVPGTAPVQLAAEAWQPAPVDESSPLAPPDGVPISGTSGPLPGLENAVGNCVVTGEVSDATSLNPVAGAYIDVLGTGRTAETDAKGRFTIGGLPQATFTLEATKLGYFTESSVITTLEGQPAEVRFGLRLKPADDTAEETTLEEETIVGEYQGESQGDFNLGLEVTPTLNSGLTSEDFAKEAVGDAGEAVEKISGANVVDGKFAVVRGLADRYINTTLNGGAISSAVPSRKAVQLDLFPTSALRGLNVDKIYSPRLTGDFGGASIDLLTKSFPDSRVAEFKFKQEYDPSLPDKMLLSADRDLEYFGGLGENINQDQITDADGLLISGVGAKPNSSNAAQAQAAKDAWSILHGNRTLIPKERDSEQKQSFSITLGDTLEVSDGIKFGFLVAGGAGGEDDFNESPILRQTGASWDQEDYQRQREWNLYAAGELQLGEFNEIRALYFRKNITQQNVSIGRGIDNGNGGTYGSLDFLENVRPYYGADADVLGGFYEIDPVEQDLEVFQLSGSHQAGKRGPKFGWTMTNSDALEDRPNYSLFRFTTLDFGATEKFNQVIDIENEKFFQQVDSFFPGEQTFSTLDEASQFLLDQGFSQAQVKRLTDRVIAQYPVVNESLGKIDTVALSEFNQESGEGNATSRTVQSIKETTEDINLNLDYPIYFQEDSEDSGVSFGFGLSRIDKTRESRGSIYELVPEFVSASGENTGGIPGNVLVGQGESLFADPAQFLNLFTGYLPGAPYYVDDTLGGILNLINNVDGFHELESHYFSADLFHGDTFVRGGVRFESETRTAEILPPRPNLPPELLFPEPINTSEILPSVSLGTSLVESKVQLLGAWSRTTARPTFYEWLPTRSIDLSTGIVRLGNPALSNAAIDNMDLSAAYQFNDTSNVRLSVFEKNITDPIIEELRDPNTIGYSNGDEGTIRGAELELELQDLGPFSLKSNLTYIDAELVYTVLSQTGEIVTTTERFPYQPNWIFNANLGYENEDWDFGANLIYNFIGEYNTVLRRVSTDSNLLQSSQHSLDLVLRKGFGRDEDDSGWLITVGIKNLIATDQEFTWQGGAADVDGQLQSREENPRSYFIEAKYAF